MNLKSAKLKFIGLYNSHKLTFILNPILIVLLILFVFFFNTLSNRSATNATNPIGISDLNNDGQVNSTDYNLLLNAWGTNRTDEYDQNSDGYINGFDFAYLYLASIITPTPTTTTTPTTTPTQAPSGQSDWIQQAYDAQRTSYTPDTLTAPWRWKWS